jgi:hypothetical protein
MKQIDELDAMLNEAQEAAGMDDHVTLLAWIRERRAEDWQPIETAPKDGTKVDLWIAGKRETDCSYREEAWGWADLKVRIAGNPTHWRPIAKEPKV